MSDSKLPQKDPSMDDILSSIRKIIQEDESRTAAAIGGTPAAPAAGGATMGLGIPMGAAVRPGPVRYRDDDVLLLTDLVEDGDAVPASKPSSPAAAPLTSIAPPPPPATPAMVSATATAVEPATPADGAMAVAAVPAVADDMPQLPPPPPESPPDPSPAFEPLLEAAPSPAVQPPPTEAKPMTANPISSAMDRLARAVEEAKPPIAAPDAGPVLAGGRTLEDIVKEMLRPMLQEWIDKNLPQLVERMVEREVQRLTRP